MQNIVILGCENSHADIFLRYLAEDSYPDIHVSGVFSDDPAAAQKLHEKFGVKVMERFDEAVGQVDGVIVTARYGGLHHTYAAPYIASGIPMFIDKPFTTDEEDALEFADRLKKNGVRVTGGSCCKYIDEVQKMKQAHLENLDGSTLGGFVRTPVNLNNPYGGFHFYSHHLIEIEGEIFGRYPISVHAFENSGKITVVFHHDEYDIVGLFTDGCHRYHISRSSPTGVSGTALEVLGHSDCFRREFDDFVRLLRGGQQHQSYEDLIAPVFVANAICRALESGTEEPVRRFSL